MGLRPQQYRLKFPLTAAQVENIDTMFETLFKATRNGALTITPDQIFGTIPVPIGGTGITSYTVGDLLYASGTTTLAKLPDVATGSVLVSGGVGVAPAWSANPTLSSLTISSDAQTGNFFIVNQTGGSLPRTIFRVGFDGAVQLWDYLAITPSAGGVGFWSPGNGSMLAVGSDGGANGLNVSIMNNVYLHDFMYINSYNAAGFDSGQRRFTLTETGMLVFGPKTVGYPALKPNGSVLEVRVGDNTSLGNILAGQLAGQTLTVTLPAASWGTMAAFGANGSTNLLTLSFDQSSSEARFTGSTSGPTVLTSQSNNNVIVRSGSGNVLFDMTGRVGIGTVVPAGLFHISSDVTSTGISYFTQADASQNGFGFYYRKARGTGAVPTVITTADELGILNFTGYGGAAGYITGAAIKAISSGTIADSRVPGLLSFWTGTNAAPSVLTERVRINHSGNVGIGSTNPGSRLEVRADDASTTFAANLTQVGASFINGDTTNNNWTTIFFSDDGGTPAAILGVQYTSHTNDYAKFAFGTRGSTGFGTRLTIDEIGNVGIGTTGPTAVLHLKAGTATASSGPLKFTSGTNLTTAEAGTLEYNGTNLFFTRAGTVRENVLVAIDNVTAPTTGVGVAIVNYYGASATNYLGDPNRWLSVNVLGTTYKIPLYT